MRALVAALALAGGVIPSTVDASEPAVQVAQMARDVTDAVRKRRARSGQDHQSREEIKR